MEPIDFPERNVTFAKDQKEYLPLPAHRSSDGQVVTCWRLTRRERIKILLRGQMWLRVWIGNRPLQPLLPSVETPFVQDSFLKKLFRKI